MKNITVTVEDDVYHAARLKAAQRATSISRLVADFLRDLSREDELRAERQRRLAESFLQLDRRATNAAIGRFDRDEIYDAELR